MSNKIFHLLVWFPIIVFGQTQTENYIKTTTYKTENTISVPTPTVTVANVNVSYFDGLGKTTQQIASQQSNSGKDIITHFAYDNFGRQNKEYLPYVPNTLTSLDIKNNALTEINNFYNTAAYENTTNPYSEKQLEFSPLNRVLQQASQGNDWGLTIPAGSTNNHTIKLDYQTNSANEVKIYKATSTWQPTTGKYDIALTGGSTFFLANQLYKSIVKNENWKSSDGNNNTTEEFKNKENQVILKRTYDNNVQHDTYYIFDQFSNLTYVLPPLVTDPTIATQMSGLCYQYIHDYRNRLIEKKLPGKQWEYIVYDKLDRPIAIGPAYSPFSDSSVGAVGWLITKYDIFNRAIYTGWELSTTVTSAGRFSKQNAINTLTNFNESKTTATTIDGVTVYYTNNITPTTFKLLTVNYYDNYDFPVFTPAITFGTTDYNNSTLKPKGMPTGSWVRTLTTATSTIGERSYVVYDYKARPIKTFLQNYLTGYTQVVSGLDFTGKTLFTETKHKRTNADVEILVREDFAYTAQDRLLTHSHKVNALPTEVLATNTYNELGQLISKNVGGTATAPLQKVDYAYNIRGWLTGINNDPTNNIILNTTEKDLFAFKINYNTVENVTDYTGTALYNGNIAETFWRSSSDNIMRKYGYKYDNLNRLRSALYMKPEANVKLLNCYNESINYDKNGNILALIRNGNYDGSNPLNLIKIDDLTYSYSNVNSPNQLTKVAEDVNKNPNGFKDGLNTNDDYSYDLNGNILIDQNKGITSIKYNHLNLPIEIVFNNNPNTKITYLYNANGVKLSKNVRKVATGNGATTHYLSGFQYLNSTLQFFPTAEGYVNNTQVGTVQNFNYVYNYQDHLGNIRLSYSKDPTTNVLKILEENHYYPFGLKHANYNSDLNAFKQSTTSTAVQLKAAAIPAPIDPIAQILPYQIKFQGQNRDADLGLNWDSFKWRNYDMAIGRFMSIDPLTEKYMDWTPYAFSGNRVVDSRELEGLEPVEVNKNTQLLVITVNGRAGGMYGDKIIGNNTLVNNLPSGYNNVDDGLSMIGQKGFDVNNARIVNYAGSDGDITAGHIAETIGNFRNTNPNGHVALIGHSLGGKAVLDAANIVNNSSIKNKTIDLIMTMEAASTDGKGSAYSANLGSNVTNIVNFNSSQSSMTGGGGKTTSGSSTNITLPSGTTHTNMDNTLTPYVAPILNQMSKGVNPVNLINNINFNNTKVLNNGDIKPNATGGSSY